MVKNKKVVIALLLFGFSLVFFFHKLLTYPLTRWDELFWIDKSYFFELAIKGDFKNELWQTVFSYDQPKLGEYMFGYFFYPSYLTSEKKLANPQYTYWQYLIDHSFFESEWAELYPQYMPEYAKNNPNYIYWRTDGVKLPEEYIREYGANFIPTYEMILQGRRINAVLLALSVALVFLIASELEKPTIGVITAVLFALNPLTLWAGLHVHSEALFLLLFNLGILLIIKFYKCNARSRKLLILCGVIFGLCFSTKLVGLMLLFAFIAIGGLFIFKEKVIQRSTLIRTLLNMLIVSAITVGLFIALNPYTYANPVERIPKMFAWRSRVVQDQYPYDEHQIPDNFSARLVNIYKNFYGPERSGEFNAILEGKLPYLFVMNGTLFILGSGFLVWTVFKRTEKATEVLQFGVIFALLNFFAGIYLKLNYNQYFVHLVFFFTFIQTVGLYESLRIVLEWIGVKMINIGKTGR